MSDLFGKEVRNKCGQVRKVGSALFRAPSLIRGSAAPHFTSPRVREGAETSTKGPAGLGRGDRLRQLIDASHRLQAEMGNIDEQLSQLQRPYDVLKAQFEASHNALAEAWVERDHSAAARVTRKPLYAARLATGFAWGPIKRAYKALQTYRKTIVIELQAINGEIER